MLSAACLLTGALALQASPPAVPGPPTEIRRPAADAPSAPATQPVSPAPVQSTTVPASNVERADRPIHDLFRNLGRDLVRLPSRDTFLIASAGGGAALAAGAADDDFHGWMMGRGPVRYVEAGNVLGDGWTQAGAALGTYATGLLLKHDKAIHVGSDLIRGQILNAVLTRGLKLAAHRDRPSGSPDAMPSGHTSATFATAAVLHEHFGWKAGVAGYAAAGFVGWSRLRDDHHWLTDVVIGSTIGLVAGRTVTAGHRDRNWTIVPIATHESAAVYVVLVDRQ